MSFDRLAPFYRTMERLLAGPKLQRCRTAWLTEVRERPIHRILLAGEGHGRFLEICAREFPTTAITCVDASAEMLRVAERRWRQVGGNGTVEFIQAKIPDWQADPFDLIVTNFFLDCFSPEELPAVIACLGRLAHPETRWLLADFTVPERGWQRWRARMILGLAYAFFRRVTGLSARCITPPDPFLKREGFRLVRRQTREWGLLHADLWIKSSTQTRT